MKRIPSLLLTIGLAVILTSCFTGGPTAPTSGPNQTQTAVIGSDGGSVTTSGGQAASFDAGALTGSTTVTLKTYTTPPTTYIDGVTPIAWRTVLSFASSALAKDKGIFLQLPPLPNYTSAQHAVAEIGLRKPDGTDFTYLVNYDPSTPDGRVIRLDSSVLLGVLGTPLPTNITITAQPVSIAHVASQAVTPQAAGSFPKPNQTYVGLYRVLASYSKQDVSTACSDKTHEYIPTSSFDHVTTAVTPPADGRIPVVLVHGWLVLGHYMASGILRNNLPADATFADEVCSWEALTDAYYNDAGYQDVRDHFTLYTFGYDSELPIAMNAANLGHAIETAFPNTPVVIVAHSMGGVISNAYMHTAAGPSHVSHIISLGTPYRGSADLMCERASTLKFTDPANPSSTEEWPICDKVRINSQLRSGAIAAAFALPGIVANERPALIGATLGFLSHITYLANAFQGTRDLAWDQGANYQRPGLCSGKPCLKTVQGQANPYLVDINKQSFQHYGDYTAFYGLINLTHLSSDMSANASALALGSIGYPSDMIVPVESGTLNLTGQSPFTDIVRKYGIPHPNLGGGSKDNLYQASDGSEGIHDALMALAPANPPLSITRFQADPNPATARNPTTFSWAIAGGSGTPTCILDPGDGSAALTINDCATTTSQTYTYPSASGSPYTATLSISGEGVSATAIVTVYSIPASITSFQADPNSVSVGSATTFSWAITGGSGTLTCILDPGDGTSPLTISDCGYTTSQPYRYANAGTYTATLAIQGTSISSTVSVTVDNAGSGYLSDATSVAGNSARSMALKNDGTVWTWGGGRTSASMVSGLLNVSAIAAGDYHSLALKSDGTVWAWGNNSSGQLGDGTTTNRATPVEVSGLSNVTAIAAGAKYSLALKSDGTVWAWGNNSENELGDGTTTDRATPVEVSGLSNVTAIAAKSYHSVAARSDGTAWAWGYNPDGELGDGTTRTPSTPVQVVDPTGTGFLTNVVAIASGTAFSIALKDDGTVWGWGYNGTGALGDGTKDDHHTPVQVSGLSDAISIAVGSMHSLAMAQDGTLWAWGYDSNGQLGDGNHSISRYTPVQVSGLTNVTDIAGGWWHSLAVAQDGTVWAWGYNSNGELGDGTTSERYTPVQVTTAP